MQHVLKQFEQIGDLITIGVTGDIRTCNWKQTEHIKDLKSIGCLVYDAKTNRYEYALLTKKGGWNIFIFSTDSSPSRELYDSIVILKRLVLLKFEKKDATDMDHLDLHYRSCFQYNHTAYNCTVDDMAVKVCNIVRGHNKTN